MYLKDGRIAVWMLVGLIVLGAAAVTIFHGSMQPRALSKEKLSLGSIIYRKNDVRVRAAESISWMPADKAQPIHVRDAVFSGQDSEARVALKNGDKIVVGANSMVVFDQSRDMQLADLSLGQFRLSVRGKTKIYIHEKMATIVGDHSDIAISVDKNGRSQLKLLSGPATVQIEGAPSPIVMALDQPIEISAPAPIDQPQVASIQSPVADPMSEPMPVPEPASPVAPYKTSLRPAKRHLVPLVQAMRRPLERSLPSPQVLPPPKPLSSELTDPWLSVWVGSGVDYLNFTQKGQGTLDSGHFAKLSARTLTLGANIRLAPRWRIQTEYHDRPGKITTKEGISMDRTDYHWRSLNGEGQYRLPTNTLIKYDLLLGIQLHEVPFLDVRDDGGVSLLSNRLRNLSIGGKAEYLSYAHWQYEGMIRYQTILGSKSMQGDGFTAKPRWMFDGSLGLTKRLLSGWRFGVFWFGQYQSIKYDFNDKDSQSSGSQSFFNSSLEFRLGYDFQK